MYTQYYCFICIHYHFISVHVDDIIVNAHRLSVFFRDVMNGMPALFTGWRSRDKDRRLAGLHCYVITRESSATES